MKAFVRVLLLIILLLLPCFAFADLSVYFLDVGQADAIFINADGHSMIIDGGNASDSQLIYSFLSRHCSSGIIDYAVATHPHEDSFEGVQYIVPVFNKKKRRLVVIPCREEEPGSIEWARKKADGTLTNKIIKNRDLVSRISSFMRWDLRFRYKLLGEVRMSRRGPILVFECDEAMIFYKTNVELLTHNKS